MQRRHASRATALKTRFVDDIRLLGKKGLSFDLCMRSAELGDAAKLIDACPDTSFILDHCGNASGIRRKRPLGKTIKNNHGIRDF